MRPVVFIIVNLIIVSNLLSQNNEQYYYDCPTSSYENSIKFQNLIINNQLDSAQIELDKWIELCGEREITIRSLVLLKLKKGEILDKLILDQMFYHLIDFIQRDSLSGMNQKMYYEYNRPFYCYVPIGERFDYFTKDQFSLLAKNNVEEVEFIRRIYSGEYHNYFEDIKMLDPVKSEIRKDYMNEVNVYKNLNSGHYSFLIGYWIPINSNSTLGAHPEIGFQLGLKKSKWNYDLTLAFRFLNAKNEYLARRGDTGLNELTKHFFGGFMSADIGYDIIKHKKNEIQFFGGIGVDGFDALNKRGELNATSIFSYNFSFGINVRHYLKNRSYLGLKCRYNFVDYSAGNKVDFNEKPISLGVVYGFVQNQIKDSSLEYLKY